MARALVIEEESGTSRGFVHPHNGYYAGDFARSVDLAPSTEAGPHAAAPFGRAQHREAPASGFASASHWSWPQAA